MAHTGPLTDAGRCCRLPGAVALALALGWPGAACAGDPAADEFFETEVRPVLVEKCAGCHGPQKQRGGLRLDSAEAVRAGGDTGPAVVHGKPDQSLLVQAVRRGGELKMPPDNPLPPRQVAALVRWVELGAPWPKGGTAARPAGADHWAFRPVRNPPVPAVRNSAWVRTPIDAFILAKLEAEKFNPSPAADRRTLIRRATYDLHGLPPTPEEVEAFVADADPSAYEKLIDRLLASPRYGEQWGRHWLDVARYSDTKGYVYAREERFWVHAWAYRDWVIRALNADMPYDRFLVLQLAADQTATDPTDRAAMGFLTLNRRFLGVTHEIADDRIDVVTRGMLGLTVACARCHSHKYDPIPTEDYYSLYGVFRSAAEELVPLAAPGADKAFTRGLNERQAKLAAAMSAERAGAAARARARVTDYLLAQLELHKYPEEGFDQVLYETDVIPASVRRWRDFLARTAATRDPVFAAWHAFARLPAAEFGAKAAGVCRELPGTANPLVARAFATSPADMADVARRYGELFASVEKQWRAALALGVATTGLSDPNAEAVRRVLHGPTSPCEVPDEAITDTEQFFPLKACEKLWRLQGEVDRWLIRSPAAPPYALVLADRAEPTTARVFRRGNPATPGAGVPRQFLQVLAGPDRKPFTTGSGRLELAKAIADPANPLTARVMVNRAWMHHFGAGLVRTPSDFGTRAEPPSHPELLDWLAARFVADGWSLKKLHRLVMLSAAYQQSSGTPAGTRNPASADPENRWLWRMNARRLSFEETRDSLFAAAGDLDTRAGGKPVELFRSPYPRRRTVYGLIDREFFPGTLRVFDFANPDLHTPQRSETTIPQQALFFLNDPLLLDRARALARHPAVTKADTPEGKVRALYRLAYQREPTATQVQLAVELVRVAEADASAGPRVPTGSLGGAIRDARGFLRGTLPPLRPWEQLAQALLMANEFSFVD